MLLYAHAYIFLQIKVKLPGAIFKEVNVDLTDKHLSVRSPKYRLALHLPHSCDSKNGRAQWITDQETLNITVRMKREYDFVNFWHFFHLVRFPSKLHDSSMMGATYCLLSLLLSNTVLLHALLKIKLLEKNIHRLLVSRTGRQKTNLSVKNCIDLLLINISLR